MSCPHNTNVIILLLLGDKKDGEMDQILFLIMSRLKNSQPASKKIWNSFSILTQSYSYCIHLPNPTPRIFEIIIKKTDCVLLRNVVNISITIFPPLPASHIFIIVYTQQLNKIIQLKKVRGTRTSSAQWNALFVHVRLCLSNIVILMLVACFISFVGLLYCWSVWSKCFISNCGIDYGRFW